MSYDVGLGSANEFGSLCWLLMLLTPQATETGSAFSMWTWQTQLCVLISRVELLFPLSEFNSLLCYHLSQKRSWQQNSGNITVILGEIFQLYGFKNFFAHFLEVSQVIATFAISTYAKSKGNDFLTWASEMDMRLDSTVGLRATRGETCV